MTYLYECRNCGSFEIEQKITEEAINKCPKCGESVERLITNTSHAILKGTGWPGKEIKAR